MRLKKLPVALALAAIGSGAAPFAEAVPPPSPPGLPPFLLRQFSNQASGLLESGQLDPGAQLQQNRKYAITQMIQQRLFGELMQKIAAKGKVGQPPQGMNGQPPPGQMPPGIGGPPPQGITGQPPPEQMPPRKPPQGAGGPPNTQYGFVSVDTDGAASTGIWRYNLGYVNTNLSNNKDALALGGFTSHGSSSGYFNYSVPITKGGTRLGFSYSANTSKVKHGKAEMKRMGIESAASYWGFNLTHPLADKPAFRLEAFLEYNQLYTRGDANKFRWLDEKIKHVQGGLAFTHFGKDAVLYHEHTLVSGDWDSKFAKEKNYTRYQLNLIGKKLLPHHQTLSLRAMLQMTGQDRISSADQFYIGGATSVRGYKENILNGEKGYTLNLEYSVPQNKHGDWLYFLDYGKVSGASVVGDNNLFGYGAGYRHRFGRDISATLLFGIPRDKRVNQLEQGNFRVHFTLYGKF